MKNHEKSWSAFLLGCGVILLILLGVSKDMRGNLEEGENENGISEEKEQSDKIPVIRYLANVYVMNVDDDLVTLYEDGEEKRYFIQAGIKADIEDGRSGVADLLLTDEKVTDFFWKDQKIHGVVHDWGEDHITLEEYGRFELTANLKGYRLYGKLKMMEVKDLRLGEDGADYIMEDGKICAILFAREEERNDIRVLIRTKGYLDPFHDQIELQGDQGFRVCYQEGTLWKEIAYEPGTCLQIDRDSQFLQGEEKRLKIIPDHLTDGIKVLNLGRDMGDPEYSGELEIMAKEEGLVLIDILPLEEYLYYVIPSEMPASYPMEALKAQAICARTYAYGFLKHAGYPALSAHVDDSVRYQVYYNMESQAMTTQAVRETYGILLEEENGDLAETYYYSTSCGHGTDEAAWGIVEDKKEYLKGKKICRTLENDLKGNKGESEATEKSAEFLRGMDPNDYECDYPWYRWTYQVKNMDIQAFADRVRANLETEENMIPFHEIQDLRITERGSGGVALRLEIQTDVGVYEIYGEYGIRSVLCDGSTKVRRGDGLEINCQKLLPSAFFLLETRKQDENVIGFSLEGGGYGHGIGMSQNAAKKMAEEGKTAEEILLFFYEGCSMHGIQSEEATLR